MLLRWAYTQIIGTNYAPLVADVFLFCYERKFMKSLSRENQADIIGAFNSTSKYLGDLLNIDHIHFEPMVDRIILYPAEIQLNKAETPIPKCLPIPKCRFGIWIYPT